MNFTEDARKLFERLPPIGGNKEHVLIVIATALAAAYERGKMEERERCAVLCEDTAMTSPYGNLKPTHDIYLPEPSHHKEDKSHHTGMGYAALLRNQP